MPQFPAILCFRVSWLCSMFNQCHNSSAQFILSVHSLCMSNRGRKFQRLHMTASHIHILSSFTVFPGDKGNLCTVKEGRTEGMTLERGKASLRQKAKGG